MNVTLTRLKRAHQIKESLIRALWAHYRPARWSAEKAFFNRQTIHCKLLPLLMAVIVAFGGSRAVANDADQSPPSKLAPNWILPTTDNQSISLYEFADSGKQIVMIFWSTWCKNCGELLPQLNELSQSEGSKNTVFVLMNLWEDGDAISYAREKNLTMPLILQSERVAQRYKITTTPGIVVVSKNKEVLYVRPNHHTTQDVIKELAGIIR